MKDVINLSKPQLLPVEIGKSQIYWTKNHQMTTPYDLLKELQKQLFTKSYGVTAWQFLECGITVKSLIRLIPSIPAIPFTPPPSFDAYNWKHQSCASCDLNLSKPSISVLLYKTVLLSFKKPSFFLSKNRPSFFKKPSFFLSSKTVLPSFLFI